MKTTGSRHRSFAEDISFETFATHSTSVPRISVFCTGSVVAPKCLVFRVRPARWEPASPLRVVGLPRAPSQRSRVIGWSMMPRMGRPASSSEMSVPKSGLPVSTAHMSPVWPAGRCEASVRGMLTCDEASGAVNRVQHPQVSAPTAAQVHACLLPIDAVVWKGCTDELPHGCLCLLVCHCHGALICFGFNADGRPTWHQSMVEADLA